MTLMEETGEMRRNWGIRIQFSILYDCLHLHNHDNWKRRRELDIIHTGVKNILARYPLPLFFYASVSEVAHPLKKSESQNILVSISLFIYFWLDFECHFFIYGCNKQEKVCLYIFKNLIGWQFLGFIFRIPREMKRPSVQEIIFGASMQFQNLSPIVSYFSSCCDTTEESREVWQEGKWDIIMLPNYVYGNYPYYMQ